MRARANNEDRLRRRVAKRIAGAALRYAAYLESLPSAGSATVGR